MKRFVIFAASIAMIALTGCSKIDIDSNDLMGTYWTGTLHHSDYAQDEFDNVSFEFDYGHADFTYLEYATNETEEGVALYEANGKVISFSKANTLIDGPWTITIAKGERMALERSHEDKMLTLELIRRR